MHACIIAIELHLSRHLLLRSHYAHLNAKANIRTEVLTLLTMDIHLIITKDTTDILTGVIVTSRF